MLVVGGGQQSSTALYVCDSQEIDWAIAALYQSNHNDKGFDQPTYSISLGNASYLGMDYFHYWLICFLNYFDLLFYAVSGEKVKNAISQSPNWIIHMF